MPTTLVCRDREDQLRTHSKMIAPIFGCAALLAAALITSNTGAAGAISNGKRISVKLSNKEAGARTVGTIKLRPRGIKSIKGNGLVGSTFYLPKGALVSAQNLGSCNKEKLEKTGRCSKKALISTGSTKIRTTYEGMENLNASIRLYSGEKLGELLMRVHEPQTDITMIMEGEIKGAGAKGYSYGFEFNKLPVEPLGEGSGVFIYPSQMILKIASKSLYRNPIKCNKRGWRFGVQFKYQKGGSSPIYGKRVPCRA